MADALGGEEAREAPQALTPEQRRRNVRRVKEAEEALDGLQARLVEIAYSASVMHTRLHAIRRELRAALDLPELEFPPPPLVEKIAAAGQGKETDEDDDDTG